MIDPKDNQETSFIHRTTEIKPSRNISQYLIGRPLPTADAAHETIGKAVGLAVFASDALSSTAYATQEMLVILAAAGTLAFGSSGRLTEETESTLRIRSATRLLRHTIQVPGQVSQCTW